jgi:peptidoglycan/LPS O-acetylase OafA/YrhL
VLSVTPLRFLGRISYGAYLFHATIYQMWDRTGLIPNIVARSIVDISSVLLVATISFVFIEEPIRRKQVHLPGWRRRQARATQDVRLLDQQLSTGLATDSAQWRDPRPVDSVGVVVAASDTVS